MESYQYRPANFSSCQINGNYVSKVVYSPTSPWIEEYLETVLNNSGRLEIEGFDNAAALDEFFDQTNLDSESIFGIEFDDFLLVKRFEVLLSAIERFRLF